MLQLETVEPHTFAILEELMVLPLLKKFSLVVGTTLSLLYGHRKSEDLDLFTNLPFENDHVIKGLKKKYKDKFIVEEKPPRFGIFCYIENVKVDIIRHPHPLIRPEQTVDNIRMYSLEDIIAMKVQAVLGRAKKKDFWDIAELLKHFSVQDFIDFHRVKFSTQNLLITVPQAITFFADAEDSADPISLKKQTWKSVQKFIQSKVQEYLK